MEKYTGDIVMFPKWKTKLENEGLEAVRQKRYQEAVELLLPLVNYEVASREVVTGLLMSWVELGQYDDAEELCQDQMKFDPEQYYHYLHIYITILFQDNRYLELVDLLDEIFETEDIPHQSRTQLWQMYEVSSKLLQDSYQKQGEKLAHSFFAAIENDDLHNQWLSIQQLIKQPILNNTESFEQVLMSDSVHPIIKTAIIHWFRDNSVGREIHLHKFSKDITVIPARLNSFESEYIIQQIQLRLGAMEQSNPTMYEMVIRLLIHYCYVRYPLYPNEDELEYIVEALKQLGHEYLQLPYPKKQDSREVEKYKEEIELCEQHYVLLVGE
ncbi:hypothetical protein MUO14_02620 [Halobacillus shinanisalinarum]|uniref:Tetratricopeptide repeat protein n=1 Tax=Halobacillus shinanisalinarum TaxID=2932258 RepID=A0ABY4H0C7_9BACI|nr:hypothetical protein [Halobacillus shinanisalinarum]UOQ93895.1 hypothetical protein MUO14_02620 [Halobacillus shinanisalinarum]